MVQKADKILILALETSCDETSAAIVADGLQILSSVVASQVDWHRKYGGVVPEIASRKHLELLNPVIAEALQEAEVEFSELDAIAATRGPGLVGGLLVGLSAAKALALALERPFIGVNHIAGHVYSNFLAHGDIETPVICLTISGGHTDLLLFNELDHYQILGRTRDDAAGEAFDKVARFLGLGYPGGPAIEELAASGDSNAIDFPRALLQEDTYDFSFSGLKTAVINYVHNREQQDRDYNTADIAASFQQAVIDILQDRVLKAVKEFDVKNVTLAGGVAANQHLRQSLKAKLSLLKTPLYYPPLELCTDNAAMIASVAYFKYINEDYSPLSLDADPNLKL